MSTIAGSRMKGSCIAPAATTARPRPPAMPTTPPNSDSTTASTRNWVSPWAPWAPIASRDLDALNVGVAGNAALVGAQRHQDDIVLIGAQARLPLGLEQAGHLAGNLVDAQLLP